MHLTQENRTGTSTLILWSPSEGLFTTVYSLSISTWLLIDSLPSTPINVIYTYQTGLLISEEDAFRFIYQRISVYFTLKISYLKLPQSRVKTFSRT
jgi:hypothetical protein